MSPIETEVRAQHIAAVRDFNRFYTREIGVLERTLLQSRFSLAEARVLFEISSREEATAKEIGAELGLDAGYLSRIIQAFSDEGLIARTPLPADRRHFRLSLTKKGRAAFEVLDRDSHLSIGKMLDRLKESDEVRFVDAMRDIRQMLSERPAKYPVAQLRPHRPGDMGWVVQLHGRLYAQEFGWDMSFEAMVAEIVSDFVKNFDDAYERCWIADIGGRQVGSVFLVRQSDEVAKLRLLIVDPAARGTGLGKQLVDECIAFARERGYRTITLWTQSMLLAARGIYERTGFRLIGSEPHRSFGQDLIGETWELTL